MFPQHVHLEHHILEMLAFQWDGKRESAMGLVDELQRELVMRDAVLCRAHHRITSEGENRLELGVERKSDGEHFHVTLFGDDDWLVISLHEQRFHLIERLRSFEGEDLFRRVRPVVVLTPRSPEPPQVGA